MNLVGATPCSRKKTAGQYFIAVIVLFLMGYLATHYYCLQIQLHDMQVEIQKNKENQAGQSQVQTELSTQRSVTQKQITDLTDQITHLQERLEALGAERPLQKQSLDSMRTDFETIRRSEEDLSRTVQKLQANTTQEFNALNKSISDMEKLQAEREKVIAEKSTKETFHSTPPPALPATPVVP